MCLIAFIVTLTRRRNVEITMTMTIKIIMTMTNSCEIQTSSRLIGDDRFEFRVIGGSHFSSRRVECTLGTSH